MSKERDMLTIRRKNHVTCQCERVMLTVREKGHVDYQGKGPC